MPNHRFSRGSVHCLPAKCPACYLYTIITVLLLSLASAAFAQDGAQTAPAALDQLVESSATILRGHVISAVAEPHPQFANLQTVLITISVIKVMKGQAPSIYTFRQFVWDPRDVADTAGYRKAGELLLFLNPVSQYGLTSPVGLDQGRFRVIRDTKGRGFAVNGRGNFALFDQVSNKASTRGITLSRQAQSMMAKSGGLASLDSLEETIAALVGKNQ
jgi:hypothetical protein